MTNKIRKKQKHKILLHIMFEMSVNNLNGDNGDIQQAIAKIKEKRKAFFSTLLITI